jgi:hypothetical protein
MIDNDFSADDPQRTAEDETEDNGLATAYQKPKQAGMDLEDLVVTTFVAIYS